MFANCSLCQFPLDIDDGETVVCPNCGTENSRKKSRRGMTRIDDDTSIFFGHYVDENGDIWDEDEL